MFKLQDSKELTMYMKYRIKLKLKESNFNKVKELLHKSKLNKALEIARIFREYLESLGISQPPATGVDVVKSQPTGISAFDVDKFYASLPQYTQQGIMAPANLSRFTDALKMFPGMA